MSLWDEIRKGTAQSIDPLGIGVSGGAQLIAGKDNYSPLVDLGTTGTQVARMVALAVASYFTFGGASAAAPASGSGATSTGAGTVATDAGANVAGTGAASSAAPATDVAAAGAPAAAGTPVTASANAVASTPTTSAGGGLFTSDNAMRAAGYLAMAGSSGGGYSAPNVATPTPFQRAPRPNAVPYNPQPSNSNRPTDTMGGTLATSPQGVTGKATTTSRLGTRRLLG